MDNETIKLSDIKHSEFNHQYEEVKKCPKCSSVFISETECESCHFQFNYDYLGEPLGEKSFYTIREGYLDSIGYLAKTYAFFEKRRGGIEMFKRSVFHRFELLLNYFCGPKLLTATAHNIYYRELKDIVSELMRLKVSEDLIWKQLDSMIDHEAQVNTNIYQQISLSIEEARLNDKILERPAWQRLFEYRILGTMRFGMILLFIVSALIAVLLSLSVYRYLLLLY